MRVAIVDDEHLVRLGIQTYLQSAGAGYRVSGVYADGSAALEALRQNRVDILLTDINMPVMDGIELIENCRREKLATHIVVLSCHQEFDLVRRAFVCGAEEYVLKHEVEQDQLVEVLTRVAGQPATDDSDSHAPVVTEELHQDSPGDGENQGLSTGLEPRLPVIVASYRFCNRYDHRFRVVPWVAESNALNAEITRALEPFRPAAHINASTGPLIVIGLRSSEEIEPYRRARKAAEAVMTQVRRYWNREMQIWIAPEPQPLPEAPLDFGIRESHALKEWGFHYAGDTVIVDDPRRGMRSETTDGELRFSQNPTVPRILLGERDIPDAWIAAIQDYLASVVSTMVPASHLHLALSGMLHQLDRDLTDTVNSSLHEIVMAGEDNGKHPISLLSFMQTLDRIDVIRDWLVALLSRVAEKLTETYHRKTDVGRILSYLDSAYDQPLRLDDLATRFSISKAYLCSRVREQTNLTLSQHINRRRIERARELLRTSNLSAKEVCFIVGYDNPNYFSRVFKAISGESVTDFRNSVNEPRNSVPGLND